MFHYIEFFKSSNYAFLVFTVKTNAAAIITKKPNTASEPVVPVFGNSFPRSSVVVLSDVVCVAGVTGTSGSGVLVFVTTNPSVTFPEISLTYPFPTGSSLIEYSIFSPALYSSNSVKFPVY